MIPRESTPPKTPLVIHVGVTGHRHLDEQAIEPITRAITDLLTQVVRITRNQWAQSADMYAQTPPIFRCISSLAQAADQLVAELALAHAFELQAPLPFPRNEYARDFPTGPTAQRFTRLLDQAGAVLELDGSREEESEAYRQAGLVVLEQSDLLVAVWDQRRQLGGKGGTADIVAEAMRREIPVVVVDPGEAGAIQVIRNPPCTSWEEGLTRTIQALIWPKDGTSNICRKEAFSTHYFSEKWPTRNLIGSFAKPFEYLLAGEFARVSWEPDPPSLALKEEWPHQLKLAPDLLVDQIDQMEPILDRHYIWADKLALYYGLRYRTFGILRFLAMGLLLLGTILATFSGSGQGIGYAVELCGYGCIFFLIRKNNRQECHQKFLEYRYLAEHLRHMRALALLGRTMLTTRIPIYNSNSAPLWVNWHFRNVVRHLGLISAQIDTPYLDAFKQLCFSGMLFDQANGQLGFYAARSTTYSRIGRRLEFMGRLFFALGLAAICLRALGTFLSSGHGANVGVELWNIPALVFPALAPIFFGLKAQGEYERIAARYQAMNKALRQSHGEVEEISTPKSSLFAKIAKQCAKSMVEEVTDWRILVRQKRIKPFE